MFKAVAAILLLVLCISQVLATLDAPYLWAAYTPNQYVDSLIKGCGESTKFDVPMTLICIQHMFGYELGKLGEDIWTKNYQLLPQSNVDFLRGVKTYIAKKTANMEDHRQEFTLIKSFFFAQNEKQLALYIYRLASASLKSTLADKFKELYTSEATLSYGTSIPAQALKIMNPIILDDNTALSYYFSLDLSMNNFVGATESFTRQVMLDQVALSRTYGRTELKTRINKLINYFADATKRTYFYSAPTMVRGL